VCESLFEGCIKPVERMLREQGMSPGDLDELLLCGGASCSPQVIERLTKFFGKEPALAGMDGQYAVAKGAGLMAASLTGQLRECITLDDISQHSVGINEGGGVTARLIDKGTALTSIPTAKTKKFFTSHFDQTRVAFLVVEGESLVTCKNTPVRKFIASNFPPKEPGVAGLSSLCR
jgi:molecular chaperone DnaK